MVVAAGVIWLYALAHGQVGATQSALQDRRARFFPVGGALTGPFLGVWCSMIAVQQAQVGIASTLMSLPPIILIPLSCWIFKERISPRAVLGTLVALAGAALIFLT